ncbi:MULTISPECIES: helix-turn-helix transcriptional regulator [Myroides]|uniref:helix-turn-helix transcriptional regulator n=1 Tax=Myroides TaxID=76831 RepID=UPI002575E3D1|nr:MULTISPECIES: WYL domain-containing protein [Myroides]MDM1377664.1 WYL domain-containing protein [Myroides marinus]MDM1385132.1 WYL domain-containing protein [Myroides marinus]MDM1392148.1 WYL domain-containing protein [Myroides marinus]MEC4028565.1 WYL domain-containing protein [Myroides odoratimimus]
MKELLRIYNVLALFDRKEACTQDEIRKAISLDEADLVSYETWNRLRKKMELDYGFVVTYDKESNTSSIFFDTKIDKDKLMGLIHHFKTMGLLQGYVDQDKEMIERVEFELGKGTGSEDHFNALQHAMLQNNTVFIIHQGYTKSIPKEYEVNPLYFKQYQNRWYLVVELSDKGEFRAFGMDRIHQVKPKGTVFKNRIKEAKLAFSQVVGLDLKGNGLQDVIIAFDPSQKAYVESLKLHPSQTVIADTPERYIIKIRVSPNYELQQQIQKFGSLAEVLEGDWVCF